MPQRILLLVFLPALAHGYVQGLGAGPMQEQPCSAPDALTATNALTASRRLQTSIRGGLSTVFSEPARNSFSLEVDVGWRFGSEASGCIETKGLFRSLRWTEHSALVLVDLELPVPRVDDSLVGLKIGWNVRKGGSSFVKFPLLFEPQFTAAVGPSWGAGRWGFGASIAVRFLLELRIAVTLFPGGAPILGVHLGASDLHGLFFD